MDLLYNPWLAGWLLACSKTLVLALIFPKEITRLKGGSYKVALTTYTECIVQRNINMGSEYQIVCPTFPSVTRLWVN